MARASYRKAPALKYEQSIPHHLTRANSQQTSRPSPSTTCRAPTLGPPPTKNPLLSPPPAQQPNPTHTPQSLPHPARTCPPPPAPSHLHRLRGDLGGLGLELGSRAVPLGFNSQGRSGRGGISGEGAVGRELPHGRPARGKEACGREVELVSNGVGGWVCHTQSRDWTQRAGWPAGHSGLLHLSAQALAKCCKAASLCGAAPVGHDVHKLELKGRPCWHVHGGGPQVALGPAQLRRRGRLPATQLGDAARHAQVLAKRHLQEAQRGAVGSAQLSSEVATQGARRLAPCPHARAAWDTVHRKCIGCPPPVGRPHLELHGKLDGHRLYRLPSAAGAHNLPLSRHADHRGRSAAGRPGAARRARPRVAPSWQGLRPPRGGVPQLAPGRHGLHACSGRKPLDGP